MCSSRCEMPGLLVGSRCASRCRSRSRAPPSARAGTRSVTTRTPRGSVVMPCSVLTRWRNCSVSSRWRGRPRAALAAVAARPGRAARRAAAALAAVGADRGRPPPPPPPAADAAPAPRRSCRRSPGRRRRRRPMRPRSRSTSTTRTLTSSPLLSTSSTRLDALAGRDVGDVQQAVGALGELDEGAEGRRLDDLADVLVADLDLLHHHPDALDQRVAELAVGGVDQHLAVVVDVDLRLELLGTGRGSFRRPCRSAGRSGSGRSGSSGSAARTAERLARRLDASRPSCRG